MPPDFCCICTLVTRDGHCLPEGSHGDEPSPCIAHERHADSVPHSHVAHAEAQERVVLTVSQPGESITTSVLNVRLQAPRLLQFLRFTFREAFCKPMQRAVAAGLVHGLLEASWEACSITATE